MRKHVASVMPVIPEKRRGGNVGSGALLELHEFLRACLSYRSRNTKLAKMIMIQNLRADHLRLQLRNGGEYADKAELWIVPPGTRLEDAKLQQGGSAQPRRPAEIRNPGSS
jgi:hypothetical protein